jgi:arginine/glutamate-rich protein 1
MKILMKINDKGFSYTQAEERLAMVEEQRLMEEERQKMRKEHEKRVKEEQKKILGKNNSRPKLSFSLKPVT